MEKIKRLNLQGFWIGTFGTKKVPKAKNGVFTVQKRYDKKFLGGVLGVKIGKIAYTFAVYNK